MASKCPANWYEVRNDASGDALWWNRRCGGYEVRRVNSLDGLQTEALHTPDEGVPVSLGVYSSRDGAMAACVEHIEARAKRICMGAL